ncbi:MAG: 2Fe-2S iron-sulfur cluster-binding protein, partial [Chloroflexota bacterium]
FYAGFRETVMQPNEMLVDIFFPALEPSRQRGTFIKLALRRAQAISVVNIATILEFDAGTISAAAITLGSVAATIIHAPNAEELLIGRQLDEETISLAADLVAACATPIDDIRSTASYRTAMLRVCTIRALRALSTETIPSNIPSDPVFLLGKNADSKVTDSSKHSTEEPIRSTINGQEYTFTNSQHKSLLRLIREDALLTGTKEGCAEGECGACTVFLDGAAVMSCMVSAPRAHNATIITIEGLASNGNLHPVQQSFIDAGAVQCGYCTPGFIMSAAKLLEEDSSPSAEKIQDAITGNLCRCTGYYKIIQAIQLATKSEV